LYRKKKYWEKSNVKSPLSYIHKIAKQKKAVRDQQEAEEGLFHELIKETSSHPPPVPFGEELVPPRFESYDTEPPGYLDPPPIEMLLDLERKFKDFTEIKISPELLELLKTLVIYPSCKSLREAAEILGWNEQQYQRAKKNLQRNRSLLASILKK